MWPADGLTYKQWLRKQFLCPALKFVILDSFMYGLAISTMIAFFIANACVNRWAMLILKPLPPLFLGLRCLIHLVYVCLAKKRREMLAVADKQHVQGTPTNSLKWSGRPMPIEVQFYFENNFNGVFRLLLYQLPLCIALEIC